MLLLYRIASKASRVQLRLEDKQARSSALCKANEVGLASKLKVLDTLAACWLLSRTREKDEVNVELQAVAGGRIANLTASLFVLYTRAKINNFTRAEPLFGQPLDVISESDRWVYLHPRRRKVSQSLDSASLIMQ